MFIEPAMFNLLMTTGAVISLVQVVVVLYLVFLTKRYWNLKKHQEALRGSIYKKEEEILQTARERGKEIIDEAIVKAARFEKSGQVNREEMTRAMEAAVLGKVTSDLEGNVRTDLEHFREAVSKKLEEVYGVMEREVAQEREKRLKKLDEEIFGIIAKVSEEVLGRAISTREQEEMVMEALERAK